MTRILGLLMALVLVAFIASSLRGTIAEPATSTTAVAAAGALATAHVISQLTVCLLMLLLFVVSVSGIVFAVIWIRRGNDFSARARNAPDVSPPLVQTPVAIPHARTRTIYRIARRRNHTARVARKWFR